jgi:hypothetical protein
MTGGGDVPSIMYIHADYALWINPKIEIELA